MIRELRFALYAIKKNIQSSAELRASFLTNIVGMGINNTAFIILWGFFVKSVGVIGGWTVADIIGLQGFVALCFGIVFSAGAGIRRLAEYVSTGVFDRFMLAPKSLLVRVATSSFGVSALGDIVFGIVCLGIYAALIHADMYQLLLMIPLILVSSIVFFSAAVTVYSVSFLFSDANSVANSLFELFMTPAMFHGGAFQGAMRFFFTFMIPSLLVGSLPIEIVRDISLGKFAVVTALASFWFVFSIWLFNRAVRKYESSNFMTFGV